MQKVTGIGGIFFKATNPEMLSAWYEKHLGIPAPPLTYEESDWQQKAGPTVFAPMSRTAEHFERTADLYINFRVDDLGALCRQLQDAGIEVHLDPTSYPNGRFASLVDPEGNQIQLWEPN